MSKLHGSQENFGKIPILGLVAESSATGSPPASPVNGQFWYDTTLNRMYIRENGAWVLATQTGAILSGGAAGGSLAGTYPNPTIAAGAVGTTELANDGVTYAKMQNVSATNKLLGRVTAGAGDTEEIGLAADHAFSGGNLQLGAFTGDVGKSAASLATTIQAQAVSYAKMQNVSATNRLLGRSTAGAGSPEEISLSADLALSAGALQVGAYTGDISKVAGSLATAVVAGAITIAKLNSAVTLNAIATAYAATADITASSQKIINLGTPTAATDAATKGYVDSIAAGLDPKGSVRVASVANVAGITYTAAGGASARGQITVAPNTLDGVSLAAGDRILLKNQTTGAQNGIWVVTTLGTGANGVWDRATDFDTDAEVTTGAFTFVEAGTQAATGWVLSTLNPIVIGGASGTSLTFVQFSGGAAYIGGNGLTLTGSTFDVNVDSSSIEINSDILRVKALGITNAMLAGSIDLTTKVTNNLPVANGGTGSATAAGARTNLGAVGKYSATLGALTAGVELNINHALGTTEVLAMFRDASTNFEIEFSWRVVDANNIGVTADAAFSASAVKVVVIG